MLNVKDIKKIEWLVNGRYVKFENVENYINPEMLADIELRLGALRNQVNDVSDRELGEIIFLPPIIAAYLHEFNYTELKFLEMLFIQEELVSIKNGRSECVFLASDPPLILINDSLSLK